MSNSHELQVATLGMKVAEDLREYVKTDSKEIEQKLVETLCKSPTLYERLFNKKSHELKQELVRQELQVIRRHNAKVMDMHFDMLYRNMTVVANVYIAELEARGQAHLNNVFQELSANAISSSKQRLKNSNREFEEMLRDIEEVYGHRPDILERRMQGIYRQMDIEMEASEQALKNLLQVLRKNLDS